MEAVAEPNVPTKRCLPGLEVCMQRLAGVQERKALRNVQGDAAAAANNRADRVGRS